MMAFANSEALLESSIRLSSVFTMIVRFEALDNAIIQRLEFWPLYLVEKNEVLRGKCFWLT